MYQGMEDCWLLPSVFDYMLTPAECIVQRDISPVFYCLNDAKTYVSTLYVVALYTVKNSSTFRDGLTNEKHEVSTC